MRVCMHDFKVRDQWVIKVLEEEDFVVEGVERKAVGELDQVQLGFFRKDVVDVWGEEGELLEEAGAEGALDRRFELSLLGGGYSELGS